MRSFFFMASALVWAVPGCSEPTTPAVDAVTHDSSTDAGTDAGTDTSQDGGDTADAVAVTPVFRFATEVGQRLSTAPFPNDLYLKAGGGIDVEIDEDPGLVDAAKPEMLTLWESQARLRSGFAFSAPVRFFVDGTPDMATAEGKVLLIDTINGTELPVQLHWDPYTSSIVVFPQWGQSMRPGRTYVALVTTGVMTMDGKTIDAADGFDTILTDGASPAQAAFAPLRAWLATNTDVTPVVATVFTTNSVAQLGQAIVSAVDGYSLATPSQVIGRNGAGGSDVVAPSIEGAALDTYFGTTAPPWNTMPANWGPSSRADAVNVPGISDPYEGGTMHTFIGRVVHGSLRMPAFHWSSDGNGGVVNSAFQRQTDGTITTSLEVLVPFTLYLCDTHLTAPANLPVAMFQHGGTGERLGAIAIANMNCQNNKVATFTMDGPFHGGRIEVELDAANDLVVPIRADAKNIYTGLGAADPAFTPDYQGDGGGALETVGPLFALGAALNPAILETNLLSIAAETLVAVRYLKEGDWAALVPGLSFDATHIFHTSLSFGSSFTTAALAMGADFKGVVSSVPSGYILSSNLLMAPSNAGLAATAFKSLVGSPWTVNEITTVGYRDFGVGMIQWLSERSDPLAWAREVGTVPVLSSGNSWDETLYTPAQITFNNAFGFNVYTSGSDWTLAAGVPGAPTVVGTDFAGPTNDSRALFYNAKSCHSQLVTPICANTYEAMPAPVPKLAERHAFGSPICALHAQADHFIGSLLAGNATGEIIAPTGNCDDFYTTPTP